MADESLESFTRAVRSAWGPLTTELVAACGEQMLRLLGAPAAEPWLAGLHADSPHVRELYRDPSHDFLLLAHAEERGLYRPPHDHGRGWVLYAVQRGEMEMSSYRRVHDLRGDARLVKRETFALRPGDVRVFLPGDIHDTRCTSGPLTLFRLTSRDLKNEEVTRYADPRSAASTAPKPTA